MELPVVQSRLKRIYLMTALSNFGLGLITIFEPIYFLTLGYTFSVVMLWYLALFLVFIIACFITVFVTNKIGLVYSLYIRFFLVITHLLMLFTLGNHPEFFYFIAVITGLEWAFYWIPLNTLFMRSFDRNNSGSDLGKLSAYPEVAAILSPLVGGIIVTQFGFPFLFGTAIAIVLFAIIPLLPLSSERTDFIFKWNRVKKTVVKHWPFFKTEFIARFAEDTMMIWTIFIYLSISNVLELGIIGTIIALSMAIFNLLVGKLTDRWSRVKMFRLGAILISVSWLSAFVVGQYFPNKWLFYLTTIGMTIAYKCFFIPYRSIMFERTREDDSQFLVLREIPDFLGKFCLFCMAILLRNHLPILLLIISIIHSYFWFISIKKLETVTP